MLQAYLQLRPPALIMAREATRHGCLGFEIFDPSGGARWVQAPAFNQEYRRLTRHERKILKMTDDEANIARISDNPEDADA